MSELDVSKLLSVAEARAILDATAASPRMEKRAIGQSAGWVLAEELRCDRDFPPFEKSLMDGYAVRSADLRGGARELTLRDKIMAGQTADRALSAGETVAVMTGAPIPAGADSVVPVEQVVFSADAGKVRFSEPIAPGKNIAHRGSDARAGAVVLTAGTRLGPAQIAVAASVGAGQVAVYSPPSISVLGTGDELVGVDQTPTGAQIRGGNSVMLVSLFARWNCPTMDLGIVPDDREAIGRFIEQGLTSDILVISGGMSMGEKDYVPGLVREMGAEVKISKLRIRPGKPFMFAVTREGKFIFGLPGNPVSAFVCSVCLVRRLIDRLTGSGDGDYRRVGGLATALPANGPREFYQPSIVNRDGITPLFPQGSADIFTLARATALLIRPENQPPQPAGAAAEYLDI